MRRILLLLPVVLAVLARGTAAEPEPASPYEIEQVATGCRFTEGPALDPHGRVCFTDIPNERILRFDPAKGKTAVLREDSGRANGLAFDADGRLLACEGARRRLVRIHGDKTTVLAERFEGKRLNSPNDLALDSHGGVYFTDPRYGRQEGRELDYEGVFYRAADGELTRVAQEVVKPNGILLSAEGKTLYVADSARKLIMRYDVASAGRPTKGRVFARLDEKARGGPDGMTRDDAGNVYCAGQGRVWIWDPKGTEVAQVRMPENPTNCAFTSKGGGTLYVTARTSLYRLKRRTPAGG